MRLVLAGDTMLGRGVAETLGSAEPTSLVAPDIVEEMRAADVTILNLECCVSERGSPISIPGKPFFFRAPPRATELLRHLGVDCVSLANNHALDFGETALLDTFEHLAAAGIGWVGAGPDLVSARSPVTIASGAEEVEVIAFTDHPAAYSAGPTTPGAAYVDLHDGVASWVTDSLASSADRCVLVTPHWGPNMAADPLAYVRAAAAQLVDAGASLVAGHSAHVFHGVERTVLYDMGDFLDDYHVDPVMRNDLGLLFAVDIEGGRPRQLEAVPLTLEYCWTGRAEGEEARWVSDRFRAACEALGSEVTEADGRLRLSF